MKTGILSSLALALVLAAFTSSASAATLRCGSHLIQDGGRHGPTMYEVLKKCGEPKKRISYTWIYNIQGKAWQLNFSSSGILLTIQRAER
jgi:hypothetical protein